MRSNRPGEERLRAAVGVIVVLLFLVVSGPLGGHQESMPSELVVVELASRPAEQVIPLVLPHIREGEVTISGSGRRVVVGGMPDQVSEVLAMIDALDQPPRQLLITVAEGTLGEEEANLGTLPGPATQTPKAQTPKGTGGRFAYRTRRRVLAEMESYHADAARGMHTRSRVGSRYFRQIPLLEGKWADVYAGPSIAEGQYAVELRAHQNLAVFADVTDPDPRIWFSVRALLLKDQVTVDVAFLQDGAKGYDSARRQKRGIRTTVKGRLGQWLLVSPSRSSAPLDQDAQTALATATRAKGPLPVWVRVDGMDR